MKGDNPGEPFEWYQEEYNRPARYDKIVGELASSKEERRSLLESYFKPTDEEREDGIKTPSEAHRSIAWLMDEEYIRVVLTTNFDNLLETALRERGVEPTVISTTEAARGAEPLAHIGPVILKIHGDYKETNLKNTTEELGFYEEPMKELIDEVFDDYGLIICGWSGDTDTALREALLESPDRRYSTFWTHRSEPSDLAEEIVAHRKGFKLQIEGAEQFFSELKENVRALEKAEDGAPLTREVIRERTKQYLTREERRVNLTDLLKDETERVYSQAFDYNALPLNEDVNEDTVKERLETYKQQVEKLAIATSTCAYYGPEVVNPATKRVLQTVERLGSSTIPPGTTYKKSFKSLRKYPATRLSYAIRTAAVAADNWELIIQLLSLDIMDDEATRSAAIYLSPVKICAWIPSDVSYNYNTIKCGLKENLRHPLSDVIPDHQQYKEAFGTFELVSDMVYTEWYGTLLGSEVDAPRAAYSKSLFEELEEEYHSGGWIQEVLHNCIQPDSDTRVPELFRKFEREKTWW